MSAIVLNERTVEMSPRFKARIAGVFYLLTFVAGTFSLLVRNRWGLGAGIIAGVSYVAVTLLFYGIFKPVNRTLSLLAAIVSLGGCAVGVIGASGLVAIPINSLVFFGFYCLLIGHLIFRSTFLPPFLGVAMMVAGLGWLTFLAPTLARDLAPYTFAPGIIGEGLLTLWLLVFGLNAERWNEQARTATNPGFGDRP